MDWKALLAYITGSVDQELRFGERSLRHVLTEYVTHFHHERPHQGKGNVVLMPVSCSKPQLGRPVLSSVTNVSAAY
jgi:hypothetical protein